MSRDLRRAPVLRCLLVWAAVTSAVLPLLVALTGDLALPTGARDSFATSLATLAAATLAACAVWLWLVTTLTVVEAARGQVGRARLACPTVFRRAVLAACGVALTAAIAPAQADSPASAPGLPPQPLTTVATAPTGATVTVRAGDSLWRIAEGRLGDQATDAEVDRVWHRIWRANREVVGADPDLVLPGQRLEIPAVQR